MNNVTPIEPTDARSPAFADGYKAAQGGPADNPHAPDTEAYRDWHDGWEMARIRNLQFDFVREQVNEPPAWSTRPIQAWEDVYSRDMAAFVMRDYWTDTGSVNVFRVVGTCHADYQGRSWLDFLTAGKRMPHNLQKLIDNPAYYLELCPRRPRIDYYTLDGLDFYVGSDGNHRTCIARFFLAGRGISQLHDVTVHHQHVDWAFYKTYRDLRDALRAHQVLATVEPERHQLGRDDTAGWKVDCYAPFLVWRDAETGEDIELDRDAAQDKLTEIRAQSRLQARNRMPLSRRIKRLIGRREAS